MCLTDNFFPSDEEPFSIRTMVLVISLVFVVFLALFIVLFLPVLFYFLVVKRKRHRIVNTPCGSESCDLRCYSTSGSGSGQLRLGLRTIGQSIKLCEVIGQGRYGNVSTGSYQGELVAVKKFLSRDQDAWVREKEVYSSPLCHENILHYIASDVLSFDGVTEHWLITQYHPNGSLYSYLKRTALSVAEVLHMALSILRGLTYLHTHIRGTTYKPPIAHRDLKSGNILVKKDLECCLCDFGHSVVSAADGDRVERMVLVHQGSRRYMAPEILDGTMEVQSFDAYLNVDVYALGLVLWELVSRCQLEDFKCGLSGKQCRCLVRVIVCG